MKCPDRITSRFRWSLRSNLAADLFWAIFKTDRKFKLKKMKTMIERNLQPLTLAQNRCVSSDDVKSFAKKWNQLWLMSRRRTKVFVWTGLDIYSLKNKKALFAYRRTKKSIAFIKKIHIDTSKLTSGRKWILSEFDEIKTCGRKLLFRNFSVNSVVISSA